MKRFLKANEVLERPWIEYFSILDLWLACCFVFCFVALIITVLQTLCECKAQRKYRMSQTGDSEVLLPQGEILICDNDCDG